MCETKYFENTLLFVGSHLTYLKKKKLLTRYQKKNLELFGAWNYCVLSPGLKTDPLKIAPILQKQWDELFCYLPDIKT